MRSTSSCSALLWKLSSAAPRVAAIDFRRSSMAGSVTSPYQPGSRRPSRFRLGPLMSRIRGMAAGHSIGPRVICPEIAPNRRRTAPICGNSADFGDFCPDPGLGGFQVDLAGIERADDREDDVGLLTVQLAHVEGD